MADDLDFNQGDSGASATFPMQCSALRKGGFVMIKNRPCKIVEMSTSKTGKHGHAKVHMVALDIFTGKKLEELSPSTHNMEVPNVKRKDYQLIGLEDDFLSMMDDTGDTREDLQCPDNDVGNEIRDAIANETDILVTVLGACGEECVIATKINTAVDK
jgi:translation initiation factor 5A